MFTNYSIIIIITMEVASFDALTILSAYTNTLLALWNGLNFQWNHRGKLSIFSRFFFECIDSCVRYNAISIRMHFTSSIFYEFYVNIVFILYIAFTKTYALLILYSNRRLSLFRSLSLFYRISNNHFCILYSAGLRRYLLF